MNTQTNTAEAVSLKTAPATQWQIDPSHSSATFSIKHMMISKTHGLFEKLSGDLVYNPDDLSASRVEAIIEAASINTRESQRDAHLRGPDFFDVEKFPTITFKSERFEKNADGDIKVIGELTIHGVTQKVTLNVEEPSEEQNDPWGNVRLGIAATTKIKRKDFGLTWNAALETGGILVGDDVAISLDIEFIKQK